MTNMNFDALKYFQNFDYNFLNDKNIRIRTWLGYVNYNLETNDWILFQMGKIKGNGFANLMKFLRK